MSDISKEIVVVAIDDDPAADQYVPIFRARKACTLAAAYAWQTDDIAANTDNYVSLALKNGGTAGTATTAMSGTVGGLGGWTGLTPETFTISAGALTAGQVVVLLYDEEGTTAPGSPMVIQLELTY